MACASKNLLRNIRKKVVSAVVFVCLVSTSGSNTELLLPGVYLPTLTKVSWSNEDMYSRGCVTTKP